jgi:SCP-2 sterol transfer family
VPPFLSADWVAALATALAAAPLPPHDAFAPFTLRQIVTGRPDGDGGYGVSFSEDGIRVVDGGVPGPDDLVFTTDYATAVALNRGDLSAQEAIESGRLEVRGRLERIIGARKMLVALDDAARELRAVTIYDPIP